MTEVFLSVLRFDRCAPLSHLSSCVCDSWTSLQSCKEEYYGNEVLPQDTTHLILRPHYQRGSLCQDLAGNQIIRRPPNHRKETQTEMVWTCLSFMRSGQSHLAGHSERGKKTRQTEKEMGRQHQGMDRPGEQWRTGKWRKLVVKSSVVPQRPPRLRNRRRKEEKGQLVSQLVL